MWMRLISEWQIRLGVNQEIFSSCLGRPSITPISAALEPCLSHLDGQLTAAWGDGLVNTGTVIYFNSLCVCRRLSWGTDSC